MGTAVEKFIDKDDLFAIEELVDKRVKKMLKDLKDQKVNADEMNLTELFERMRNEDEKIDLKEEKEYERKFQKLKSKDKKENDSSFAGSFIRTFIQRVEMVKFILNDFAVGQDSNLRNDSFKLLSSNFYLS